MKHHFIATENCIIMRHLEIQQYHSQIRLQVNCCTEKNAIIITIKTILKVLTFAYFIILKALRSFLK